MCVRSFDKMNVICPQCLQINWGFTEQHDPLNPAARRDCLSSCSGTKHRAEEKSFQNEYFSIVIKFNSLSPQTIVIVSCFCLFSVHYPLFWQLQLCFSLQSDSGISGPNPSCSEGGEVVCTQANRFTARSSRTVKRLYVSQGVKPKILSEIIGKRN